MTATLSVAIPFRLCFSVDPESISSFPVPVRGGEWEIVQKLPINKFSRQKIDKSVAELKKERALVADLLS
jgi:malate dehydrogenase